MKSIIITDKSGNEIHLDTTGSNMKVINKMIFVSLIFILISCDGQNKNNNNSTDHKAQNKMREEFGFKACDERTSAVHRITKNDTIIEMTFIENKIGTTLKSLRNHLPVHL